MQKRNYLKSLTTVMLLLTSFLMVSCGSTSDTIDTKKEDPTKEDTQKEVTEAIVEKTGATSEVTSLLQTALNTPEVQQAILNNKSFNINVSVPDGSSAAGETITIPVSGGEGKNGGIVTIKFTDAITGTNESNPLNFRAANASSAADGAVGSGNSDNQLTINMPSGSSGLVITIDLPDTTVKLTTNGTVVYKQVTARTALNTLVVDKGVTVEDFVANGGRVKIMQGGKMNRLVFAPRVYPPGPAAYQHDELFIDKLGAFGLAIMNIEGDYDNPKNWTTFAVQNNGEWYRFENLKILPPVDCYCMKITPGIGANGEKPNLKTITIADGAAILLSDYGPEFDSTGRTVKDKSTSTAFRDLEAEITGEGNDARVYYQPWLRLGGYKTMTNVKVMPMPDIDLDNLNRSLEHGGWEHLALMDVQTGCDNCTFYLEQLTWKPEFLLDHKDIIFKNSKFKKVKINAKEAPYEPNGLSFRIGADLNELSGTDAGDISITFDGCDFEDGFRFFMNSDTEANISSFTFKFINCTYDNKPMSKAIAESINKQFEIPTSTYRHFVSDFNPLHKGHVYYIIGKSEDKAVKYELIEDPSVSIDGPKPLIFVQVDPSLS